MKKFCLLFHERTRSSLSYGSLVLIGELKHVSLVPVKIQICSQLHVFQFFLFRPSLLVCCYISAFTFQHRSLERKTHLHRTYYNSKENGFMLKCKKKKKHHNCWIRIWFLCFSITKAWNCTNGGFCTLSARLCKYLSEKFWIGLDGALIGCRLRIAVDSPAWLKLSCQ